LGWAAIGLGLLMIITGVFGVGPTLSDGFPVGRLLLGLFWLIAGVRAVWPRSRTREAE
jgi:hypothetical protein